MKKLDHTWLGPYSDTKFISQNAYRLKLPLPFGHTHPVFSVTLLGPYNMNAISECIQCDPPPQLSIMESRSRRWNAFWIVGCSEGYLIIWYTGKGMASKRMSGDLQRISKALDDWCPNSIKGIQKLPNRCPHWTSPISHSTLSSISLTPPTPSLLGGP